MRQVSVTWRGTCGASDVFFVLELFDKLSYTLTMKYKQPADGLNKRIGIRLTQNEFCVLRYLANKHNMTISNYVRKIIKGAK